MSTAPISSAQHVAVEAVRSSIARIIVELERIDHHLAVAAVELPTPVPCQFVAAPSTSAAQVDATHGGARNEGAIVSGATARLGHGERLLFIEDVAEWTGIPVQTLRWWRQHGTGPRSAKIGARVRYREADVQVWIDARWEEAS
jgi:predicted DNA-binding transcriptional regulator AlpA